MRLASSPTLTPLLVLALLAPLLAIETSAAPAAQALAVQDANAGQLQYSSATLALEDIACDIPGIPNDETCETLVRLSSDNLLRGAISANGLHRTFLGVPYAQPPVGSLRWRAPVPLKQPAWSGVRPALAFGSACTQVSSRESNSAEDCLFANIWTPRLNRIGKNRKLPVMVFVHGGSFVFGSGSNSAYDGSHFVEEHDVLLVTINYRLGVFGYLASKQLADSDFDHEGFGNYGLQDVRQALRWVKQEIASFGGDPERITVFGESAGSISISYLTYLQKKEGLIHRAILESGTVDTSRPRPIADVQPLFDYLVKSFNCGKSTPSEVVDCLRAIPAASIFNAVNKGPYEDFSWASVVDGVEIFDRSTFNSNPRDAFPIDLLLGNNLDEGSLFVTSPPNDAESYQSFLKTVKVNPALAGELPGVYPLSEYLNPKEASWAVLGDSIFACPTRREARKAASVGSDIYLYRWEAHLRSSPRREVYHSIELNYVFGNGLFSSNNERTLSKITRKAWADFAIKGTPGWPVYTGINGYVARFTDSGLVAGTDDFRQIQCDFWDDSRSRDFVL